LFVCVAQSANPLVKAQEIMLEYNMPQEQFDRIKAAFEHYDKDQNGAIGTWRWRWWPR